MAAPLPDRVQPLRAASPIETVLAHTETELLDRLVEDTARIAEAPRCHSVSSSPCNSEVIERELMILPVTEHGYPARYT